MIENRKKFFSTEELRQLHPELSVREDRYDGVDYVVFLNDGKPMGGKALTWPDGIELWVEHEHELNVDGKIYDPLRFYDDRRGLTELTTGMVFGQIGTMAEVVTQQLFGSYISHVMFGEWGVTNDATKRLFVRSPYDLEPLLSDGSTSTKCVLIRSTTDKCKSAVQSLISESDSFLYHCIQYTNDGLRRCEFMVWPLVDGMHSARTQTILVKDYVHFYAAMYESCIMLAHHDQSKRKSSK